MTAIDRTYTQALVDRINELEAGLVGRMCWAYLESRRMRRLRDDVGNRAASWHYDIEARVYLGQARSLRRLLRDGVL